MNKRRQRHGQLPGEFREKDSARAQYLAGFHRGAEQFCPVPHTRAKGKGNRWLSRTAKIQHILRQAVLHSTVMKSANRVCGGQSGCGGA
jgi:hypothetical protein